MPHCHPRPSPTHKLTTGESQPLASARNLEDGSCHEAFHLNEEIRVNDLAKQETLLKECSC